jgi:hypothetical protein
LHEKTSGISGREFLLMRGAFWHEAGRKIRNPRRIEDMASGLKSKFVEEEMANTLQQPEVSGGIVSEEAKRLAEQVRTDRARQIQALNLQRENILSQRTSHPARRAALEAALSQVEGQLQAIG